MLILKKNDSAVPFRVRLFCCRRPGLWTDWPLDGLACLWMGGLAFGWTGETFVFHLTSISGFCKYIIISILSKLLLLLDTLRGTQIHLCFCKSLIASGSGKEGWLWGGNFQASATETETEPEPRKRRDGRPRDGVTETEGQRTGRWRDGEMEK